MNIIDATTLNKESVVTPYTNMLVWNQNTGDAARIPVSTMIEQITDGVDISTIEAIASGAATTANNANTKVDGLSVDVASLRDDVNNLKNTRFDDTVSSIDSRIGNLNQLNTTKKNTIVNAINEVNSKIGSSTSSGGSSSNPDVLSAYGTYYVDDNIGVDSSVDSNAATVTSRIQAAIDDAANKGGGTLIFGNKIYVLNNLTLRSKVVMRGAGKGATILKKVRGSQSSFIFVPESETAVAIEDMTLLGPMTASEKSGASFEPSDGATCNGIHFEDMLLANGDSHINNNTDKNGNQLPVIDPYGPLYSHSKVDNTRTWTYRNSYINNVAVIGFSGSGIYVGKVNYSVFVFNSFFYLNKRHGMELWGSDSFYIQILAERNGICGIFTEAGNTKFMCIKSIWNGWDSIGAKYTDDAEITKIAGGQNHVVKNEYKSWGIFAFCTRCSFIDVEIQDNLGGGIFIRGNNAQFQNLVSDCNGYESINPNLLNPPQKHTLIKVHDSSGLIINATCSQYKTAPGNQHKPVAKYGLVLGTCRNSVINCSCVYEGVNKCAVTPYHHEPQSGYGVGSWFWGNSITIVGQGNTSSENGAANKYYGGVTSDNV